MESQVAYYKKQPHALCIPFPAQGHVNPMLKLAKLLHSNGGFHITFVNTEFNHRLIKSRGPNSLDGFPDFKFETIPDGLPPSDADATQDIVKLCELTPKHCVRPFAELVRRINSSVDDPPVTFIISDGCMSFTLDVANELRIPEVLFWTTSACGVLGYAHYRGLIDKGFIPLKDANYLTNGYLNTQVDGIPGMEGIKLKDFPSFVRTTDINDIMLNFANTEISRVQMASAVIINTFDAFEQEVIESLSKFFPPIYTVGPLHLLVDMIPDGGKLKSINSNLWKEQEDCLDWLDTKEPRSVVYVNFGSITVMTRDQLVEFAWGLANSNKQFLWIIRPDLVVGETSMLPREFVSETKDRGMLASWCPQEQVLKHPSIGGFLSHMGWNSMLESVAGGVPFVCWPFFAEQQTNCWFACDKLGVGLEIDNDVKRNEVKELVWELMDGEKGKEMRKKAMEWKVKVEEAIGPSGSSFNKMDKLVKFLQQL